MQVMDAELQQPAEQTEAEFVASVCNRLELLQSEANWFLGAAASEWTEKHAQGRTDAAFALLVDVSRDRVTKARRVVEVFGADGGEDHRLRNVLPWGHFYAAVAWPDAEETLEWASDAGATRKEMEAWHRIKHGEPDPKAELSLPVAPEPKPPIVTPVCAPVHKVTNNDAKTQGKQPETEDKPKTTPAPEPDDEDEPPATAVADEPPEPPEEPPAAADVPAADLPDCEPNEVNAALAMIQQAASGMSRTDRKEFAASLRMIADELEMPGPMTRDRGMEILQEFNEALGVKCRMTNKRMADLKQRWRLKAWRDEYSEALQRAALSPFLTGQNDRSWWMDFEFFLRPDTVTKILEGKYDGANGTKHEQKEQRTLSAIEAAEAFFAGTGTPGGNEVKGIHAEGGDRLGNDVVDSAG